MSDGDEHSGRGPGSLEVEEPNPYAPPPEDAPRREPAARSAGTQPKQGAGEKDGQRPVAAEDLAAVLTTATGLVVCLLSMQLGLVVSLWFFPLALAPGAVAIIVGARILRRARRAEVRAPGALTAIIMGSLILCFALVVNVTVAVFATEIGAFQDCAGGANTHIAEQDCRDGLQRAVQNRTG
ncbi:MAG: hypothetical protein ACRDPT_08880 [Streptomycetales bacterium]